MKNELLMSALRGHAAFSSQEEDKILSRATEKNYPKGDYLLKPPAISNTIWFTCSGVLRHFVVDEDGNTKTDMFIEPGDFLADLNSFQERKPVEGFIEAETAVETIAFRRADHEYLTKEINGWKEAINHIIQKRLEEQLQLCRTIIRLDGSETYDLMLKNHLNVVKNVPAIHLASFLGITPHSLSRIKKNRKKA